MKVICALVEHFAAAVEIRNNPGLPLSRLSSVGFPTNVGLYSIARLQQPVLASSPGCRCERLISFARMPSSCPWIGTDTAKHLTMSWRCSTTSARLWNQVIWAKLPLMHRALNACSGQGKSLCGVLPPRYIAGPASYQRWAWQATSLSLTRTNSPDSCNRFTKVLKSSGISHLRPGMGNRNEANGLDICQTPVPSRRQPLPVLVGPPEVCPLSQKCIPHQAPVHVLRISHVP